MVAECLAKLIDVTERFGGSLVKTIGDEIMATFPEPEAATRASIDMQNPFEESKLSIKVGFHSDEVIAKDGDVFCDGVNIAARLAAVAKKDKIVTSKATIDALPEEFKADVKQFDTTPVKGRVEPISMYQVIWQQKDTTMTVIHTGPDIGMAGKSVLGLAYRGEEEKVIQLNDTSFSIDRDSINDLVITDQFASRSQGKIEHAHDRFVYFDQSVNGTFIVNYDDTTKVLFVKRDSINLSESGIIFLGRKPDKNNTGAIRFRVI